MKRDKSTIDNVFGSLGLLLLATLCGSILVLPGCSVSAVLVTEGGMRVTASADQGNVTLKQDGSGKSALPSVEQNFMSTIRK